MARSLPISANFILKFHALALRQSGPLLQLFPVMDGLYATSADQDVMKKYLRDLFSGLADMFVAEQENKHRFLVRAGLAYGPVISGAEVAKEACAEIVAAPDYARTLLMGIPMIQAHLGERRAPPFGCFVDESARAFAPAGRQPLHDLWWPWFEPTSLQLGKSLRKELRSYFEWAAGRSGAIDYDPGAIDRHRKAADQFFPE